VTIIVPDFDTLKKDPNTSAWVQGTPEEMVKNEDLQAYPAQKFIAHLILLNC